MKFATARGITRSRVPLLALLALAAGGIAGCSGDGAGGGSGSVGPVGPTGPSGTGDTVAISEAETIIVTLTSATVDTANGRPTVTFSLMDGEGNGLAGLQPANVRFTAAKLIPGVNGASSEWRSYISRVNNPDPAATPVPPALPAAEQQPTEYATFETAVSGSACASTGGVFAYLGGGNYRYTFSKALDAYSNVAYDPSQTQRFGLQVRGDATCAPGANSSKLLELASASLITNGVVDVVPNGGLVASRNVIDEQQCDACHVQLGAHGGGRTTYDFCVTCHNPYTVQAATGTSFDMMYMTHQIHMGGDLAQPFAIWSPATATRPGEMEYPFAEITYPQDIRNCLTCHNDSEAGAGWRTAVTIANCTSCHDATTFAGANPTHGGGPATEDQCSACHVQSNLPQLTVAGAHAVSIAAPLAPSTPSVSEYAKRFRFEIVSIDAASFQPGGFPRFTFKVTDPTSGNSSYNLLTSPYFSGPQCDNGTARLAFDIGWSAADFNNAGSGNGPGQPISLNPLNAATDCTTLGAGVDANTDGSYTMTSSVAIPAGVTGTAVLAFEGHPAGDLDGNGSYTDRIPVKNVYRTAAVTGTASPRRQVVDIARCNACHEVLSLHGNNRTDEPQVCVICHNPSATDINRRRGATMVTDATCPQGLRSTLDGLCEQTIDMKRMIHVIHAAEFQPADAPYIVYGFGNNPIDFAEVTYPAGEKVSQCESCHTPDTYYPVDPTRVQATTTSTGANITAQDDDSGITPNTAVCSGCHTDATAALHMTQTGGSFSVAKPAGGIVTSPLETCGTCHGPGGPADVKRVHALGIYNFDDPTD